MSCEPLQLFIEAIVDWISTDHRHILHAQVTGRSVYSKLKWESGVHRVQRVPATDNQGRIHTSTATVAIMPEVCPALYA